MSIDCQAGCGDSERRMKYNAIIQTYARVLTASVGLLSRKMLKLRQKWERTPESVEIRQFSQHLGLRNLLGIVSIKSMLSSLGLQNHCSR
jgi:hypothetical protein